MAINWFPGHMKKTQREIKDNLKLVDAVIEIRDARIPRSSANPDIEKLVGNKPRLILLNKSDLTESRVTKEWMKYLTKENVSAIEVNCLKGSGLQKIKPALNELLKEKHDRLKNKGLKKIVTRVMVVGIPNVGKSTFIKMLLKEVEPTSGEIIVADKNLADIKRKQIPYYRRKIGMVYQDFRLIPNLNVYENVAFAMKVVEASPKDIRRRVPMVLSLVGLSHKYKMFPHELSGGEQQRVSLARAIVNNPSVLIADEPTGNLDPDTASEIMELLDDINKSGTTILMATHAQDIVNDMKKRVIAMERGEIVRDEKKGRYNDED